MNWNAPLFIAAPYVGSSDGWNEIGVDLHVTEPGRAFFLCVEFPPQGVRFPNDYPYLRTDVQNMELGYFGSSYRVSPTNPRPSTIVDLNLVMSMLCQLGTDELSPPKAPTQVRANLVGSNLEFAYNLLTKARVDGSLLRGDKIKSVDLIATRSDGRWSVVASAPINKAGTISINANTARLNLSPHWSLRAVDENGAISLPSNVVPISLALATWELDSEPNGSIEEAAEVPQDFGLRSAIYPPGDQDFFAISARPGDTIEALAGATNIDPVMFLYDRRGHLVARDDNSAGGTGARLRYRVPGRGKDSAPERYTVLISDVRASIFMPEGVPTPVSSPEYSFVYHAGQAERQNASATIRLVREKTSKDKAAIRYILNPSAGGSAARLRVYDVRGRLLRTVVQDVGRDRAGVAVWDYTNDRGARVAQGVYYARIEAGGQRSPVMKIVVVR